MKRTINAVFLVLTYLITANPALAQCYVNDREIPCGTFWAKYGWIFVICFLIPGLIFLFKPQWHVKFMVWSQNFFMAAKFIPSKKTEMIIRVWGGIFIVLALIFFVIKITS